MSFWNEVDSLIEKGKISKQIKVSVSDLIKTRNNMEDIQRTLRHTEKNLQEEEEKLKTLQISLQGEVEKVKMLQLNISEKVSVITQKEELIKQIQQQMTERDLIASNLQSDLDKIKSDMDNRDLEIKTAITTVSQAEELIGQRDQQIEQLNATINQKNLEIDELNRNLGDGQQSASTQDSKVPGLQLKIQTLQSKIQELESNSVTRADFDSIFNQNKDLEGRLSTFNLKIGALSNENEQLKKELAEKLKKINLLTEPHSVMAPSLGKPSAPSTFTSTSTENTYETARIVCPHCGSSKLTVVEDKSRIISYIPAPVYAKKNVCSQCGFEF